MAAGWSVDQTRALIELWSDANVWMGCRETGLFMKR